MNIVTEFTDAHLARYRGQNPRIVTFTAPEERAVGIEPALSIVTDPIDEQDLGHQVVHVAWKPNEIELVHLARGGTIWLSTWGGLPPHLLEVQAP